MPTDHYSVCEAALMTRVRTLTTYFPNNWQVSDDDSVIAKGADYFVIMRPGAFPVVARDARTKDFTWSVVFDLYVRYTTYSTSWSNFKAVRAALIDLCFSDPTLNKTANVFGVSLSSNENAQYFFFDDPRKIGVRPNFIIQTMTATILQRVNFTLAI